MPERFGRHELDVAQRLLRRDGEVVHLAPKAFDVLRLLVAERPRAVSKDEILATVWRGVFVTESTLATTIRDLRRALDDDADAPRVIRTAYAFGYAFIAEVEPHGPASMRRPSSSPTSWRLVHEGRSIDLVPGPNVIGRQSDPAHGHISIDAPTLSRCHACLTVTPAGVTCEDLGSKNGTWLGSRPVSGPVLVADGDEIRLGSIVVALRRRHAASTETMSRVAD